MSKPRSQAVHCGLRLEADEQLLWQGAPSWLSLAFGAFHIRVVVLYFAVIEILGLIGIVRSHAPLVAIVLPVAAAVIFIGLLGALAFGIARTTTYVVTSRRVILRYGAALPRSLSIPFRQIASVSLSLGRKQHGDVVIELRPENHMPYLKLWPHARPWHVRTPKPMLRGIPLAGPVASLLSRELLHSEAQHRQSGPSTGSLAA
jgi:hypothetical protein